MRKFVFLLYLLGVALTALSQNKVENVFIITTDGFRWQEVFKGMDSAIANQARYNENDSLGIYKKYWDKDEIARRKKLLPFFWSMIEVQGQIYGNRAFGNNVNVSNSYWFSYPGYSEIFCGYVDTLVNSNNYKPNPNSNVLAFINKQKGYAGKVEAFGAWNAFDRILNEKVSGIPVTNAFDPIGGDKPNSNEKLMNSMLQDSYRIFGDEECADVFTHYAAMESWKKNKPKVLYISYGETDEFAHEGKYRSYLDAAHQFDQWLEDIWTTIQNDPQYKNKTALFITVDHGRGDKIKSQWRSHGSDIEGSDEIWFAVIGEGIRAKGEVRDTMQIWQKQFAQTIASLLGMNFKAEHPVGEKISEIFK